MEGCTRRGSEAGYRAGVFRGGAWPWEYGAGVAGAGRSGSGVVEPGLGWDSASDAGGLRGLGCAHPRTEVWGLPLQRRRTTL